MATCYELPGSIVDPLGAIPLLRESSLATAETNQGNTMMKNGHMPVDFVLRRKQSRTKIPPSCRFNSAAFEFRVSSHSQPASPPSTPEASLAERPTSRELQQITVRGYAIPSGEESLRESQPGDRMAKFLRLARKALGWSQIFHGRTTLPCSSQPQCRWPKKCGPTAFSKSFC